MALERPLTTTPPAGETGTDLRAYEKAGGYSALRRAMKEMSPADVQKAVSDSHLRGRGGAGFPTGRKWSFVPMGRDAPGMKYLVVNADEMEPGTFKDRLLLTDHTHQVVEGAILSAFAIGARTAFVFLRQEYHEARRRLEKALFEARERGYLGPDILGSGFSLDMRLHVSAGRYICGEETALLNALSGARPLPRAKPPFPPVVGLWGRPTIVNNVETVSNVPHIVKNGPAWFRRLSLSGDGGTKIYGASGRVKRPGAWELPLGVSLREILMEHAGGMRDGHKLRGLLPGGASTGFLAPDQLDVPMDFDSVEKAGSRLGTGCLVVLDDRSCPVGMAANLLRFFARESCGWCTPCREGLPFLSKILNAIEAGQGRPEDLETLRCHGSMLKPGNTYCALAPGAAEPLLSALALFEEDFARHVREQRCPWSR